MYSGSFDRVFDKDSIFPNLILFMNYSCGYDFQLVDDVGMYDEFEYENISDFVKKKFIETFDLDENFEPIEKMDCPPSCNVN